MRDCRSLTSSKVAITRSSGTAGACRLPARLVAKGEDVNACRRLRSGTGALFYAGRGLRCAGLAQVHGGRRLLEVVIERLPQTRFQSHSGTESQFRFGAAGVREVVEVGWRFRRRMTGL